MPAPGSRWSRSVTRRRTSLSAKLLARPRLLREIRSLIPNPARSHLIPYNTTPLERDVALSLRHPDVRRGSPARGPRQQDRLPQDVRGTRGAVSGRGGGPPHGRRHRGGRAEHARAAAVAQPSDREAQRGRLRRRQRHGGPERAAGPWLAGRGGRDQGPPAAHAARVGEARRSTPTWPPSRSTAASSRSGSPASR